MLKHDKTIEHDLYRHLQVTLDKGKSNNVLVKVKCHLLDLSLQLLRFIRH